MLKRAAGDRVKNAAFHDPGTPEVRWIGSKRCEVYALRKWVIRQRAERALGGSQCVRASLEVLHSRMHPLQRNSMHHAAAVARSSLAGC